VNDRPGIIWRIFRRAGEQPDVTPIGVADKPEFIDTTTEYGKQYEYSVRAVLKAGGGEAESEMSSVAAISPVDRFAPGTPTGLTALAATDSIELAWDPSPEADLRGYRLYRADPHGDFSVVAEIEGTPAYSDRKIEQGKKYRYAVAAVDQLNNESPRSDPVEISAP
jgi:fibronectin type 3 domain-containing protein